MWSTEGDRYGQSVHLYLGYPVASLANRSYHYYHYYHYRRKIVE